MKFKSPSDDFERDYADRKAATARAYRKHCVTVNRKKREPLPLEKPERILIACLMVGLAILLGCLAFANFYRWL